jgi:acetyl-CoA synthetase
VWGQEAFGLPIHDNWWQTETGAIMIANYAAMPIRPGSMGRPLPGIEAAILRRGTDGKVIVENGDAVVEDRPDVEGVLALRPGWPSMFRGYLNEEERYRKCFVGGWYQTGDLARRDRDGYFWFVGRGDDLIKSSGHLIGPFEVESALLEFPAVAEAGVIGKPDPMAGEVVKAFVSLKRGYEPGDELRSELMASRASGSGRSWPRRRSTSPPRVPKTRSGKIMRRLLRAASSGCRRATPRHWRARNDYARPRASGRTTAAHGRHRPSPRPVPTDAPDPAFRGEVRRALCGDEDPRLPARLHRRGGGRGRRDAGAASGGC